MGISVKLGRFLFALIFLVVCVTDVAYAQRRNPTTAQFPAGTRFIALTFDDGPTTDETVKILDELQRISATITNPIMRPKVTFYVNGAMFVNHNNTLSDAVGAFNPQTRPILQRMITEGHDVCNHGFFHLSHGGAHEDSRLGGQNVVLTTAQQARQNIQRNSRAIFDATGYWPFSFRAPFFEFGSQIVGLDVELSMPFMHAILDANDWQPNNQSNPQGMAADIVRRAADGAIILMHDAPAGARAGTVNSLRHFIPQLIQQGYAFVTVRELFMLKQAQPERFTGSNEWNPNARVPFNANGTPRGGHRDFWPNNRDNWWTQDWWSCPTPPWERISNVNVQYNDWGTIRNEVWRAIGGNCGVVVPQRWTVTFNLNGGTHTGGGELTQTINNGQNATLPTAIRSGHNFTGWSGSHTNVTSNRTITAQWQPTGSGGGGSNYQEVIGWEWTNWNTRLADAHGVNSSVTVNNENPLRATLVVGAQSGNTWPWVTLAAFFAENFFNSLTGIEITYTSNLPVFLSVGSTQTQGTDVITYRNRLDASATPNTVILPLSAFTVPQWLISAGWSGSTNLADAPRNVIIPGLSFGHENYGQTVNLVVTSIKLHGISGGGATSIIPQARDNVRATASSLQINGLNAGILSLNVPSSGTYNVSIHDVSGRMLTQTSANLAAGVNSLAIGNNIAKGVVVVRIQGTNANLVRRISVR